MQEFILLINSLTLTLLYKAIQQSKSKEIVFIIVRNAHSKDFDIFVKATRDLALRGTTSRCINR